MVTSSASRAPIHNSMNKRLANSYKVYGRAEYMMFRAKHWHFAMFLIILLAGCAQVMSNQPKVKPLTSSDFFTDGQSARPLPPNTIARSDTVNDELLNTGKINGEDAD